MTISSAIQTKQQQIAAAYTACDGKGATMPQAQNLTNLADCIDSISAGSSPVITSLSITPTTSAQTITAPSGTDGYGPVYVAAVTSSIDQNIVAGNIKKDVTILSVTGTYEGSGGGGGSTLAERTVKANYWVDTSGVVHNLEDTSNVTLSATETTIDTQDYSSKYDGGNVTIADLSAIQTISNTLSFNMTFANNLSLTTVDMSGLEILSGASALQAMCSNSSNLVTIDLHNLKKITAFAGIANMASGTALANISLENLEEISGSTGSGFGNLTTLPTTWHFKKLNVLTGNQAMAYLFSRTNVQEIYFEALNSQSFGSATNQFYRMIRDVTGCKVHFPSNLQSVIGSWSDVSGGFGGTSTTVLFDLTATS